MSDVARKALGGAVRGGREKIKLDKLIETYPEGVTINRFDMIPAKNGDEYPAFTFVENPAQYFNGGKALKAIVYGWLKECDGDIDAANAELAAEPIKIKLSKTKTQNNQDYTKVEIIGTLKEQAS